MKTNPNSTESTIQDPSITPHSGAPIHESNNLPRRSQTEAGPTIQQLGPIHPSTNPSVLTPTTPSLQHSTNGDSDCARDLLQSHSVLPQKDVEPWPEPVNGKALLDSIA